MRPKADIIIYVYEEYVVQYVAAVTAVVDT
jgi:hypothetical protein